MSHPRKRRKIRKKKQKALQLAINKNSTKLWLPDDLRVNIVNTNSWFDIKEYTSTKVNKNKKIDLNVNNTKIIGMHKCEKVPIYPSNIQRKILFKWMECYIKMYNEVIKFYKRKRQNKEKVTYNWKIIRSRFPEIKEFRNRIIDNSQIKGISYNTKIHTHTIDFAIQDACSKFKSCLTNLKRGNIKHFRIRYLKKTKKSLILKLEKRMINKVTGKLCPRIFKDNIKCGNNFKLKDIDCDFHIHYNGKTNRFTLLNPKKVIQEDKSTTKKSVAIDPGIRTFATTFSNNECSKICNNLSEIILTELKKIDKVSNNNKKKDKIKRKVEQTYYKKINNKVNDMHWKTIKYLTKNYDTILIGNLSTKSIVSRKNNKLNSNVKKVASHMCLYKFRQKLAYKCELYKKTFIVVDEAYTSKTCTKCTHSNENLGASKIYNCSNCQVKIDRDINGARNIFMKHLE